jgi:hypothetical protein
MKGVKHAFIVEGKPNASNFPNYLNDDTGLEAGVAIVATSWWAAQSAREKLEVKWDEGKWATANSVDIAKKAEELSKQPPARTLRKDGDVEAIFKRGDVKVVESSKAAVDNAGKVVGWHNHFVGYGEGETFTHSGQVDGNEFPSRFVPNYLMQATAMPLGLKTGALRAPLQPSRLFRRGRRGDCFGE